MHGAVLVVDDVPAAFAALVAARAPRSIALSGGGTARACYEAVAGDRPDWAGVVVLFGDERWVPVDHEDSNEGMARRVLLGRVGGCDVRSMRAAGATPASAAAAYDAGLAAHGPVDLVHLGLGPDGHTASLFPGSPALDESERLVVATGDDAHPHPRITWTFPAISTGRVVVVTVAGASKRAAWARVRAGEDVPAARVRAAEVLWLVDRDAAG